MRFSLLSFLTVLALLTSATALADHPPPPDTPRDSAVTSPEVLRHAEVTQDDSVPCDAPTEPSPMLASAGLLGVAGIAGGSLLTFRPGDRVTYVDEQGQAHAALVTRWWGEHDHAACNLVHVDPDKHDSYGHERCLVSSVSRGNGQTPGRYWQPDGEPVAGVFEGTAT